LASEVKHIKLSNW